MLYIRAEDFYEEARSCSAMSRQEELQCARQMREGDALARERLIRSYLPMTAAYISRMPAHRLNWYLRNAVTRYIADR